MTELQDLAQVINIGGNAALLISVWYIRQHSQNEKRVAERLARIEAKLNIETESQKED